MTFVIVILVLILGISIIPVFLFDKFRVYCKIFQEKYSKTANKKFLASVIIPCKGTDFEFEKNLESLTLLDPEKFEVVFITATDDDPARQAIQNVIEKLKTKSLVVKLITAGIKKTCAQKLYNLVQGVKAANSDSEYLIFIDADIRLEQEMLISLLQPLSKDSIGATTGFPVFIPSKRFSSIVRFAWGIGGLLVLADKKKVFTHGAINAIRRQDFYTFQIEDRYLNSVSDSLTLTDVIRSHNKEIVFVPKAIVPSPDDISFNDLIKWSNRLTILSRIYNPTFWRMIFFNYASISVLFITLFFLTANDFKGEGFGLFLLAFSCYQIIQIYILSTNFNFILTLLPEKYRAQLTELKWRIVFYSLFAFVLIQVNLIVSLFYKTITWRGITYKIFSDKKVEVISGE